MGASSAESSRGRAGAGAGRARQATSQKNAITAAARACPVGGACVLPAVP